MAKEQIEIKALIRSDLDAGGVVKKVSAIQQLLNKVKLSPELQKKFDELFTDFNSSIDKINNQFSKGFETKGAVKSLDSMVVEMQKIVQKIAGSWEEVSSNKELIKLSPDQNKQLQNLNTQIESINSSLNDLDPSKLKETVQQLGELKSKAGQKIAGQAQDLINSGNLKEAIDLLKEVIEKRRALSEGASKGAASTATYKNDTEILEKMGVVLSDAAVKTKQLGKELEKIDSAKTTLLNDAMREFSKEVENAGGEVENINELLVQYRNRVTGAAQGSQEMTSELGQIKDKIKYFFSLNNAIQLVRQTLRQTFEAAKELDKAMTETAVVTDFSVGDMWNMLPKYTKTAQELGATTQGVYETLTLFYQQGLDVNEAVALGTETLKMARIAGMDYEEATSKMTAALRGFNMELNELSAQRVNDVYSELAAITAADTDQIATAMTKTASIANSANMEFETTAAFLAQIVETTQESAETAGTAMKTVIARFTELKKDPSLIGEVDGEIIDANKIETALNSIGVALRDNLTGQFRDLDDVFLDIAQKWESLDTNTQRYIATIAAGSRQQSRFIAMMSDYERTVELVTAANNSAGSSQAQFDKTLESMEAKLNQLKNTWQEFTLGLMNEDLLKGAIDALNSLLTAINKLTDAPGIFGAAGKGLIGFLTLFTGKKIFNIAETVLFSQIKSFRTGGEEMALSWKDGFVEEFEGTRKTIKKVFNKIFEKTELPIPEMNPKAFDQVKQGVASLSKEMDSYTARIRSMEAAGYQTLNLEKALEKASNQRVQLLGMESKFKAASISQQAAYNAAIANGAGVRQAEILLTKEATKEDYKQIAAQILGKEATEEEVKALTKKIMAEQVENGVSKSVLLTKLKSVATLLFSTNATKKEAAAKVLNIGATVGATKAQLAFNAVLQALPIGWIITGILAITAAIVGLVAIVKYFSAEGQLDRLTESTENSATAAEEAKKAYEELLNTIEERKEAAEGINNLTKGTLEFAQAVQEANLAMLELISNYPELREAGMTLTDENGVIRLTEEGEKVLKTKATQKRLNAQEINTVSQIALNNTQKKASGEALEDDIKEVKTASAVSGGIAGGGLGATAGLAGGALGGLKLGAIIGSAMGPIGTLAGAAIGTLVGSAAGAITASIGGAVGGAALGDKIASDRTQDKITEKLESEEYNSPEKVKRLFLEGAQKGADGNIEYSEEFEDFADSVGLTAKDLYKLKDSVIDFSETLEEEDRQNKSLAKEQLKASAAAAGIDSPILDSVADIYAEANKEQAEIEESDIREYENKVDSKKGKKALAAELDLDVDLAGLSEEAMAKRLYSAITGIPEEDITLSKDDLEVELAKFKIANERDFGSEGMIQFYEGLSKASENTRSDIETILSGDLEFTTYQLNNLIDAEGEVNKELFDEMVKEYEKIYGSIEVNRANLERQQKVAQANSVIDYGSSALSELGENGKIEDQTALLASLSQVEGLYGNLSNAAEEWSIVSQQGILAQMDYLTDLSQQQYYQKEQSIQAAKEQRQALIQEYEGLQVIMDNPISFIKDGNSIGEVENRLEEIQKELTSTDWVLDIKVTDNFEQVSSQIDGIVSNFDRISDAASVLSESFEVSADDGKKLSEVFPGILKNATVTADGQIQLDEEAKKSAIEKAETMITSNAEAEKNIIQQEMAKLEAFIEAKTIELGVIEKTLESGNEAHAAALLADLTNEGQFSKEIDQIEQDSLDNKLKALDAKGTNEFEYGNYSVEVNEKAATAIDRVYEKDVQNNKDAVTSKGNTQSGFLNGIKNAAAALKSGNWGDAWSAFWAGYHGAGTYISEEVNVEDITAKINEDKLKEDFDPVYTADGKLDSNATLKNYYSSQAKELEKAKSQLVSYEDVITLIDAQAKQAINDLKNPGKNKSEKNEKWEYEREYDENIKSKLKAAENEKQRLESELEGLINDENATTEDIIKKKLEIAEAAQKQLALLQEQNKLDIEEAKRLQSKHSEWSKLYSIGDNGEITWDEQAINALGLSPEQGKIFDEWSKALTTAVENAAASTNDIIDKINEINEIISTIYNEYDYLYNLELQLSQLATERQKLEREYNNLIKDSIKTIDPLVSNLKKQYTNLDQSKVAAQDKATLANLRMNAFLGREGNKDYQKYLIKDENTGKYSANVQEMEKLAASGISEAYEPVAQFIEDFMALQDDSIKAEEELLDLEQERIDLIRESKEATAELETTYYDALIEYMDRQLEETEELYSSIDDSNSRLLESIRESLELQRQERQNAETETEINDMRNRLAYLQMDTSGANQSEILNLQKQIGEKEQDYTDTLIDQKIDELERQNDKAAEQRERQISILNYNHKQALLNGEYLSKVKDAIENETNGLPGILGKINTGNEAFDKMFPKDKTMSGIISENLKYSNGKMPTTAELDKQTTGTLQLIAQATAGIEEARKDMRASDARTVLRVAQGLDSVDDLTLYQFLMYDIDNDGVLTEKDAEAILKGSVGLKGYATGGLADYTGPAWLDGTKSRPELVLNQKDTQNFLQLKDILASFMSNNNSLQNSAENRGDNYYEIHLNVEKITSDYDVEQLANKVKSIIAEDANSRGVNSIYRRR